MGTPCHSIAYPYSDYDDRAVRAGGRSRISLRRHRAARSGQPPLALQWPRVGVYHGEGARRIVAPGPDPVASAPSAVGPAPPCAAERRCA